MIDRLVSSTVDRVRRTVVAPANELIDNSIVENTSILFSSAIRSVSGKFQRSITFTIGRDYTSAWMEEALYGILYEYNDIKSMSKLEIANNPGAADGSEMYYRLGDGTHNLKYRTWNIILVVDSARSAIGNRREFRTYTIITYDLSKKFVELFEQDMYKHRNSILNIKKDSPTLNIYMDAHDNDGSTYWEKIQTIPKRPLSSIYLPREQKKLLISTVDNWFQARGTYRKHGIPWNLKILLHGPTGCGKSSIVKMIASHWNRNIYECIGGRNGIFIPDALQTSEDMLVSPLFSLSDLDKLPMLINQPEINLSKKKESKLNDESLMTMKQSFSRMINCLDGVNTAEGSIIVITTNHLENFSPVFLRPGRIDLIMEIGYVAPDVFRQYVYDWYKVKLPKGIKLKRDNLTIAEMQPQILFYKKELKEFLDLYLDQ